MIADPTQEGKVGGDTPHQSQVVRPQLATEMLGQRQVVRIVVRRQIEGVGKDKRLKVQSAGL